MMYVVDEKKAMRFTDIADLIEYLDSSIDERSSEEFLEAFATLMS
ncbi:hypothetical protein [uncultured Bacteroides sp.]|nr:hypothetical protein [uncultured Bacteroides sp.]